MPLTPEDIARVYLDDATTERIAHRKLGRVKLVIAEPNPEWPQRFLDTKVRIEAVLGSNVVTIIHVGSTSVPGLPAKDIIDIDLVVNDSANEDTYVKPLESLGFLFLLREANWYQHRFFVDEGDRPGAYPIHLHVFGPDCAEVEKHQIFRDWLAKTPEDLQLYATVKRESAEASEAAGETMTQYTMRKDKTLREILNRAYRDLGYID